MTIAIIDYGSGNLRSAAKAFARAAENADRANLEVVVTADPDVVRRASHVVLPGVGAFADCRAGLHGLDGMVEALTEAVIVGGKPFFGICVGMQLMATLGHEHGEHTGLDWIGGTVEALQPADTSLKIPHMGWNELRVRDTGHPLFDGLDDLPHTYYVHGFHLQCDNADHVLATTDYGGPVTAVVGRDNLVGTQFHPEKSQRVGLHLIGNFLKWRP